MQTFEAIDPTALDPALGSVDPAEPAEAQRSWHLAVMAMSKLLEQSTQSAETTLDPLHRRVAVKVCSVQGLILCGPAPVFSDLATLAHFKTWAFKAQSRSSFQLPPAAACLQAQAAVPVVTLSPEDCLAQEQFCLIQMPHFCWAAVLGRSKGVPQFRFTFEPIVVQHLWQALQLRVRQTSPAQHAELQKWRQKFPVTAPHYRTPAQFSRELLRQAALLPTSQTLPSSPQNSASAPLHDSAAEAESLTQGYQQAAEARDVELLKVIAHEVRTPLTTIQTLTRLLMKRSDLPEEVIRRLEGIYRECSGQIDRFGLIFRAMELTHDRCQALTNRPMPISLQEVLVENLDRWKIQAARRSLTLEVTTPKSMPVIAIRDPHLLDQVLTGVMEYLGHSLSSGSHIHLHVALAGSQLKLELKTRSDDTDPSQPSPMLEAVGQLLMFQPETGGLSLSLPVTKHLFEALGGKLTVRKHRQSEVLTIFLPLGVESDAY